LAWGLAVALLVLGGLAASRGCQNPDAKVDGALYPAAVDAGTAPTLDGAVFKAPETPPPPHPAGPEGAIFD
jgi:hypothetical protein